MIIKCCGVFVYIVSRIFVLLAVCIFVDPVVFVMCVSGSR